MSLILNVLQTCSRSPSFFAASPDHLLHFIAHFSAALINVGITTMQIWIAGGGAVSAFVELSLVESSTKADKA